MTSDSATHSLKLIGDAIEEKNWKYFADDLSNEKIEKANSLLDDCDTLADELDTKVQMVYALLTENGDVDEDEY